MPQKKSIEWQIYQSPLEEDIEEIEDEDDEDSSYNSYDSVVNIPKAGEQGKWLYTPAGMIPLPSNNKLHDNFQMFTMHVNFDLNEEAKDTLDAIPGVELVHIFSRYRAIIGIGKHSSFNSVEVRLQIEKALCKEPELEIGTKDTLALKVNALKQKFIKSGSKDWFIFVLPNSTLTAYNMIDGDRTKYDRYLEFARTLNKQINGTIYEAEKDTNIN